MGVGALANPSSGSSSRTGRSLGPLCQDVALLCVWAVVLMWASTRAWLREWLPGPDGYLVLAPILAACTVVAAILAAAVHWLSADRRAAWISAACTLYGVVGVSADAVDGGAHPGTAVSGAVRFSCHVCGAALLAVAVRPPARRAAVNPLSLSVLGLAVVALAALSAAIVPHTVGEVVGSVAIRAVVAAGVVIVGLALTAAGQVEGRRGISRLGLAMAVLAAARTLRLISDRPEVHTVYGGVELFAAVLALSSLKELAREAFGSLSDSETDRQERLREARLGLSLAADRDLELRNRLADLAAATQSLGRAEAEEARQLRRTITAELSRLEAMMVDDGERPDPRPFAIGPVVRDLVALRRCSGMDISYDGDDSLIAMGSPRELARVVTNLLANCARHAPGSPVRVRVHPCGDRVRLLVSDSGPGIPKGYESAVLGRGTRSRTTGGQGLGLHICRELLAAGGGEIELRSAPPPGSGCQVVVDLPAALTAGRADSVRASNAS